MFSRHIIINSCDHTTFDLQHITVVIKLFIDLALIAVIFLAYRNF